MICPYRTDLIVLACPIDHEALEPSHTKFSLFSSWANGVSVSGGILQGHTLCPRFAKDLAFPPVSVKYIIRMVRPFMFLVEICLQALAPSHFLS
jgi:hypothetical protein